jgi:hypothetical protein
MSDMCMVYCQYVLWYESLSYISERMTSRMWNMYTVYHQYVLYYE